MAAFIDEGAGLDVVVSGTAADDGTGPACSVGRPQPDNTIASPERATASPERATARGAPDASDSVHGALTVAHTAQLLTLGPPATV